MNIKPLADRVLILPAAAEEKTNAVAVVVSEETGIISVFRKGSFRRDLASQDIAKYLAENVR